MGVKLGYLYRFLTGRTSDQAQGGRRSILPTMKIYARAPTNASPEM